MSHLFRYTTIAGTLTWRPSSTCSRVCGIAPSGARHHEDRAVHLRRARDHVLDVVGVARAIDVRVVALVALVLDVRRRDRDAARLLFRRLVDLIERRELREALRRLDLRDRSGQRGLAVVDVTDRADVDVGLVADEFLFGHGSVSFRRGLGNQVVSKLLRDFSVVVEFHRVSRAASGPRPKVGRVTEHRGHRDKTGDGLYTTADCYSSDFSASGMQIAEDISDGFFGSYDLERHDRLEQRRDRPGWPPRRTPWTRRP